MPEPVPLHIGTAPEAQSGDEQLDRVFFALSDSTRRAILTRLGNGTALVSELAEPFDISLQAISRHIQVLVRAGLVRQERTGRISRCKLEVGPVYDAAVWLNQYSHYWQAQFDELAGWLSTMDARTDAKPAGTAAPDRTPSPDPEAVQDPNTIIPPPSKKRGP